MQCIMFTCVEISIGYLVDIWNMPVDIFGGRSSGNGKRGPPGPPKRPKGPRGGSMDQICMWMPKII